MIKLTHRKPSKEYIDKICQDIVECSGLVKIAVGNANNAAWMAVLEAHHHIALHPAYRQQRRGGDTAAKEFDRVFKMFRDYERALLYNSSIRFFHVADLIPEARAYYKDISDRDYYDFWAAGGAHNYNDNYPFFTSLVNKLRLAYLHSGVPYPEPMGWATAGQTALDIAVHVYERTMAQCKTDHPDLDDDILNEAFHWFSLKPMADWWARAVDVLAPGCVVTFSDLDAKNAAMGAAQLEDVWTNSNNIFNSQIKAVDRYMDIYRTNSTAKKLMRKYAEWREKAAINRDPHDLNNFKK
jgi:hypothetical protein